MRLRVGVHLVAAETARHRDGGNDWAVLRLAAARPGPPGRGGHLHFTGNAPGAVTIRGTDARSVDLDDPGTRFRLLPDGRPGTLGAASQITAKGRDAPPASLVRGPLNADHPPAPVAEIATAWVRRRHILNGLINGYPQAASPKLYSSAIASATGKMSISMKNLR